MGPVWVAVLHRDADRTLTVQRVAAMAGGGSCGVSGSGLSGVGGDGGGVTDVDGWDDLDSDEAEVAAFFGHPTCSGKLPIADAASPGSLPSSPGGEVDLHGSPAWVDATLRRLAALALPPAVPPHSPQWWSGAPADHASHVAADEQTTGATTAAAADGLPVGATAGVAPRAFPVAVPSLCAGGCPGGLSAATACPRVWAVACHVSPGPASADADREAPPPAAALVALASGCHAPTGLGRVAAVMDSLVVWSTVRAPWHARLGRWEAARAAAAQSAFAVASAPDRASDGDLTSGVLRSNGDDLRVGAGTGGLPAVDADDAGRSSIDSVDVTAAALSEPLEIARAVASVLSDDNTAAAREQWSSAPSLRVAPSVTRRWRSRSPSPLSSEASPPSASVPDLVPAIVGAGSPLPLSPSPISTPLGSPSRVSSGSLALLRAVGCSGLLALLTAVLLEQRVALTSVSGEAAAWATVALSSLVAPLRWAHTLVPLLPPGAVEVLCAPTPLLVGVTAADADAVTHLPVDELLVADLDSGDLTLHGGGANGGGVQRGSAACHLPRRLRASLLRHLRTCATDADVESAVGVAVATLLRREAAAGPPSGNTAALADVVAPPALSPPLRARLFSTPPPSMPAVADQGRTSGGGGGGDDIGAPSARNAALVRSWSSRSLSSMTSALTASSRSLSTESLAPTSTGAVAGATVAPAQFGAPSSSAGWAPAPYVAPTGKQDMVPPHCSDTATFPLRPASPRPPSRRSSASAVSRLAGSYRSAVAAAGLGGVKRRVAEPDAFFASLRQTSAYAAFADNQAASAAAAAGAAMGAGVGTVASSGPYWPPRDVSRARQSVGALATLPMSYPSRSSAPPASTCALAAPKPRRSAPALGGGLMLLGDPLPPGSPGVSPDLPPVLDGTTVAESVSAELCNTASSPLLADVGTARRRPLRSASGRALSSLLGIK
ncbi:hypothetical protein I4F81_008205 [Pyropia yezoensis]|uniref:Uncharacterized protein n=1 Tax=Pyropia yezoensis TaxID=2788 RepID=A0ACC3C735_PYRYE|nr:hypothetical protein I4F81_008205 [Neopyropia yezoensis]